MAVPSAVFNFFVDQATPLKVDFQDLSTNTPTSWAWNFGDSTTSILQNPSVTYGAEGRYTVSLIATNGDGSSTPFVYEILISLTPTLNQTVEQMVNASLPSGITIPAIELTQAVRRWQMYLQPKVYVPFTVAVEDTFNQAKYPGLANVLISKLIIYEQLMEQAQKTMTSQLSSESGGTSTGGIKRIESGPSVAEWYDNSETWKTVFAGKTDTGFFGSLTQDICIFASRQNIAIPELCGRKKLTTLFSIGRKACPPTWTWPISQA